MQLDLFSEDVAEVEHEGKRLVVRRDPATQRKEEQRRDDKLAELGRRVAERNAFVKQSPRAQPEAGLRSLQQWVKKHKLESFVTLALEDRTLTWTVDEEAKAQAALLDGCYCLESDVSAEKLDAQTVHDRYKDLQQVERNFRDLKTAFLEIRPIFVRTEEHTRGHAFIAMLALKITRVMEQRLRTTFGTTETNPEAETLDSALECLSRVTLNHLPIEDQTVPVVPRPDARQQRILSALQVTLTPPR